MMVDFKVIPGTMGCYKITRNGIVKSLSRPRVKEKVVAQSRMPNGYMRVSLSVCGKRRHALVHRLVLETFAGKCPQGKEAAHLNGVRDDNRVENLKWVTRKENHSHKVLHGTHQCGERNPQSVLLNRDVFRIREMLCSGVQVKMIAQIFGVSPRCIGKIKHQEAWVHLLPQAREEGA